MLSILADKINKITYLIPQNIVDRLLETKVVHLKNS